MKFRPDIEGLRGVAVLLVVLAHAGVPGFAGGFVGVDVFFVISGYLITGLLAAELERSGRVDYWAFYARRARRLAPALLFMLATVSAACLAVVPGDLLPLQLDSAFWAALWASNVWFSVASFDYFGAAARDSLFLHTWSLGVEEQFYLLWPLLMVAMARRPGRGRTWLPALLAASFAGSLLLMPIDASSAYYLMPTRLWQLALGGLVHRLVAQRAPARGTAVALGAGGAALLVVALLAIDESVPYPGLPALLPALAAAALLAAGAAGGDPVGRLLASPLLRLPGRISYSWYLWHWPILMIGPLLGWWPMGAREIVAAILVSFLVGWASYAVVETPLRRGRDHPRQVVVVSVLASILLAALLHAAGSWPRPTRDESAALEQRVRELITRPSVYADPRCDQWYRSAELVPCEVDGDGDGSAGTMVLIGDSIGTHWLPALEQAARMRGLRLVVLTKSSCPIVDEPFVYPRLHRRFTECEQWREAAVDYVARARPRMVVIGSAPTYGFSVEQWTQGSARLLARLGAAERPVVVIAPSPRLPFDGPRCVAAHGVAVRDGVRVAAGDCEADAAGGEFPDVIAALREAAAQTGAHVLYANDLVCPGGTCRAMRDGVLVFRDHQHLTADGAAAAGEGVEQRLPSTPPEPSSR